MKNVIESMIVLALFTIVTTVVAQTTQNSDPFARYTTPAECAVALTRIENEYWRARRPDTVYTGPLGRPAQPSSIEKVRRCVSRFSVNKIPRRDLLGLGYAYLAANMDAEADIAFKKLVLLTANKSIPERGWVLAQIVNIHISVSPARISKAKDYMAQLEVLGIPVASERMIAHIDLANAARVADSVPLFEEEAKAAVKASGEISVDTVRRQRAFTSAEASIALATLQMRRNDGPSSVQTLQKALNNLPVIRPAVREALLGPVSRYSLVGKPAPQVQGAKWFNDNANGSHPVSGKITTVTFASHGCGGACYPGYSVVKRLKGGPYGFLLDPVFAIRTEGYYRNQIVEPSKEFDLGQRYFLQHVEVPVAIAVWQTEFGRKPDGRLDVLSAPNEKAYHPFFIPPLQTYVIDKNGVVRFVTNMLPNREFELNNVIKSLQ